MSRVWLPLFQGNCLARLFILFHWTYHFPYRHNLRLYRQQKGYGSNTIFTPVGASLISPADQYVHCDSLDPWEQRSQWVEFAAWSKANWRLIACPACHSSTDLPISTLLSSNNPAPSAGHQKTRWSISFNPYDQMPFHFLKSWVPLSQLLDTDRFLLNHMTVAGLGHPAEGSILCPEGGLLCGLNLSYQNDITNDWRISPPSIVASPAIFTMETKIFTDIVINSYREFPDPFLFNGKKACGT